MELTEEIIKKMSTKEYMTHRKEIQDFYKKLNKKKYYKDAPLEFIPNNYLTSKEKNKKRWILEKRNKPWKRFLKYAKRRCGKGNYKNVKFLLTEEELKELWYKYNADKLNNPSLDRIDNNGNYEYGNCQFIENWHNGVKSDKLLIEYEDKKKNPCFINSLEHLLIYVEKKYLLLIINEKRIKLKNNRYLKNYYLKWYGKEYKWNFLKYV
ncbi:MAG: hypothetical protein ACTSWG_10560 [Candidatus Helarchaeota archaeon]